MKVNDIIIRPLFTEKMTQLEDLERKYAFQVSLGSNKIDIKNAVEKRFDVEVQKVATMNREHLTSLRVTGGQRIFAFFFGLRLENT